MRNAGLVTLAVAAALSGCARETDAQKAEKIRQEVVGDWNANSQTYLAQIESALAKNDLSGALEIINRYQHAGAGRSELPPLRDRVRAAKLREEINHTPADEAIRREGLYAQLASIVPNDPAVVRQAANAKAAAVAHRKKIVADEKAAKQRELVARRRAGVSIGMTQDEVVQSSWGRPERINATHHTGGTQEQWVYGNRNYLYFRNGVLTSIQTSR